MSTNTGRAPVWTMALTVALKVKLTVMTSSPGPMSKRTQDGLEGDGPVRHHHGVAHAAVLCPGSLELSGAAAHGDHAGAHDLEHGLLFRLPDVRP